MAGKSQRPKGQDDALSLLNVAIDGLNLAKEVLSVAPTRAAFGVAGDLTLIRVGFLPVYVGRLPANVYKIQ